jgi:uncharacterized membrane protein YqjE
MMALAGGLVSLVLGIIGIIIWWGYFIKALMAGIPVMLILGGALAAYLGIEEIKDKKAAERFETEKDDLKREVENLKKEIKDIKGDKETAQE